MRHIKKVIIIFTFCFAALSAESQDTVSAKSVEKGAIDLKSGNYKDVLTSFFQLAATDLTGKNKSFEFKSTLFGIKLRADSTLIVDTNFIKQTFYRNLQFEMKLNVDNNIKPQTFTAGIKYALLNRRDKALADFRGKEIGDRIGNYMKNIEQIQVEYLQSESFQNKSSEDKAQAIKELDAAINKFHQDQDLESLPKDFEDFFRNFLKANSYTVLQKGIDSAYKEIETKPLWTVALNSTTNNFNHAIDSVSFETVFLQGGVSDVFEGDVRANLTYKDTDSANDDYRMVFNGKAGLNFNLFKDVKTKKSLLEIKPQFEYNRILKGLVPNEEEERFSANAEVRIRITDKLWIPLTVKYDIKNKNLFGFLNVAWNMDVFKDFLKGD